MVRELVQIANPPDLKPEDIDRVFRDDPKINNKPRFLKVCCKNSQTKCWTKGRLSAGENNFYIDYAHDCIKTFTGTHCSNKPNISSWDIKPLIKCFFNARSLCNKLNEFRGFLSQTDHDIILVTETWFNVDITDPISINNAEFKLIRCDLRAGTRGGEELLDLLENTKILK